MRDDDVTGFTSEENITFGTFTQKNKKRNVEFVG